MIDMIDVVETADKDVPDKDVNLVGARIRTHDFCIVVHWLIDVLIGKDRRGDIP